MATMENAMTVHQIQPLKAKKFMKAVLKYMEPFRQKNNYESILDGHLQKLDIVDAGYGHWLQRLLGYLVDYYSLEHYSRETCVLDIGCGTGEFVVRMNLLGYKAKGVDLHEKHLELGKILAEENSLPHSTFVLNKKRSLPFDDNSFDIVTMFSVLEHMDDNSLRWVVPELRRVCRGVIYILVPNRLKPTDDHTGLHFVSYLPHWLASSYIKLRGRKYQYFISESGSWDVYHRSLGRVASLFKRYGYDVNFPPDDVIYPSLDTCPPVHRIGKNLQIGGQRLFLGLPLPHRMFLKFGYPKQIFYPYLNLVFVPQEGPHNKCKL